MYLMASRMMSSWVTLSLMLTLGIKLCNLKSETRLTMWPSLRHGMLFDPFRYLSCAQYFQRAYLDNSIFSVSSSSMVMLSMMDCSSSLASHSSLTTIVSALPRCLLMISRLHCPAVWIGLRGFHPVCPTSSQRRLTAHTETRSQRGGHQGHWGHQALPCHGCQHPGAETLRQQWIGRYLFKLI